MPNRSKRSIVRKLLELKLIQPCFKVKPHKKVSWTVEEINILKSSSDPRKAKIIGRSRQSIVSMASRLGILNKKTFKKPWKKKETKLLICLFKKGNTPLQIFNTGILPYSRNSIQKKLSYLGYSKKIKRNDFPKPIAIKFKSFLKKNWQGKTPKELVDLWNQQNSFKIKRNKVVYYLKSLKIKVSKLEVCRTKELNIKEEKIKNRTLNNKTIDSLRSIRAELMRQRMSENKDIWTGLPIKEILL